jgi:tetratricopeptide (TPR) repeat protein
MAREVQVVASKVGGLPEVIKNGMVGFLVEPREIEKMTERSLSILASASYRQEMEKGRERAHMRVFAQTRLLRSMRLTIFALTRQFDRALAQAQLALELDVNNPVAHWVLAVAYLHKGLADKAISTAEKGIALFGRYWFFLMVLAVCCIFAGQTAQAQKLLEELKVRSREAYVPQFSMATIYLALGDLEQALDWYAQGVEERDLITIVYLKSEPLFDPLRSHPRFQAILHKMNLIDTPP